MPSNPQTALIIAAELDHNYPKRPEGERTREILARAHLFLAFLEGADAAIDGDEARELKWSSGKHE